MKKAALALFVCALALLKPAHVHAATLEYDLHVSVNGTILSEVRKGPQTLSGVAQSFPNNPIRVELGDTLILNLLFDRTLQVRDIGEPTEEVFSFGLDWQTGPGWNGTWTSSIEALGAKGDIWTGPFTANFQGGGAGFGWGGVGVAVTDSQGSFTGIQWITTLTSANEGTFPLVLTGFTGIQLTADAIKVLKPVR